MNKRFKLYNVNIKYIRNLHNVDDNVPSVSPQVGKQGRPFLGIIVLINGSKFCIPFTSNSGKKKKNFESILQIHLNCDVGRNYVSKNLIGASHTRMILSDLQMNCTEFTPLTSHLGKEKSASIFRRWKENVIKQNIYNIQLSNSYFLY